MTAVSEEKATKVESGPFTTAVTDYALETSDAPFTRMTMTVLRYDPNRRRPKMTTDVVTPKFRDISDGLILPEASFAITLRTMMIDVAGTRDLNPVHHNREFPRATCAADIFVNTMFYEAFFGRLVTDWAGPEAFLRRISFTMRLHNCPGDTTRSRAWVVGKRHENGLNPVDLEVRLDNERVSDTTIGQMTVELP